MSKINLEWDTDRHGKSCIRASKKRGKISTDELQEAMHNNRSMNEGYWAIIFKTCEDGYQCWFNEEPVGDEVFIYQVDDGESCPVCFKDLVIDYCPHCGENIRGTEE